MRERLLDLARRVRAALLPHLAAPGRKPTARRRTGDPHFVIDEIAERATREVLLGWDVPLAYFSEDRGLVCLSDEPEVLLIIDPIDGTRPALAGFESCCFSVAVAPWCARPTMAHVTHALVMELPGGAYFYADASTDGVLTSRPQGARPSALTDLTRMFWSIELTAHPVHRLMEVYGHLVDGSVAAGAVFVFTSSSYSLTRIVTGQLDAHVDIGHRVLRDRPELEPEFLATGRGALVTLFPYDIAAAAFIAAKAGAVVTSAYGEPLDDLALLTDKSLDGQCSIIAAANPELHRDIIASLRWRRKEAP
jgi:myo-inositol-1(or 4)-monophosphatase